MKITHDEVKHIASLARMSITEEETNKHADEMGHIIALADMFSELDTTNVVPTNHAIKVSNVFRQDVVEPSFDRDALLANAPDKQAGCFGVPKIVE